MSGKVGNQTIAITRKVIIRNRACIVSKKEKAGPLGEFFDQVEDEKFEEETWEKAESKFMKSTYSKLVTSCNITDQDVDCILSGDLLNQCMATGFALKHTGRPIIGLYGACSTMAESTAIGALLVDGGGFNNVVCMTSSHYCSAEKQFRGPLELGTQRAPTSQWTVTGSGGIILSSEGDGPVITNVTLGKILDFNIADSNNMGAAMAPSAASTIITHLKDTGRVPDYYDLIVTGDLGIYGRQLCEKIMQEEGVHFTQNRYKDCGELIFDPLVQDTHAGGSGCGCSAVVLTGYLLDMMQKKQINRLLFVATGALMSPTSVKQGVPILGVAHAIAIENV